MSVFKKSIKNGYEVTEGKFWSFRKLDCDSSEKKLDSINSHNPQYYISNNQIEREAIEELNNRSSQDKDYFSNQICKRLFFEGEENEENSKSSRFSLSFIGYILLIVFIILVFIDLLYYLNNIKKENQLDKSTCYLEYEENHCSKVKLSDGPELFNFCKEREKCMNITTETVFFHSAIIKMFKEIFQSLFLEMSYKNFFTSICVILLLPVLIRLFFCLV